MRSLLVAIVVLAALSGAGCGEEEAPLLPTYTVDVAPIMGARCIRCHGAGGTLNKDPDADPVLDVQRPKNGNFTQLDDVNGIHGLRYYTAQGMGGVGSMKLYLPQMPPPPAPPLTDREYNIILNWAMNPLP